MAETWSKPLLAAVVADVRKANVRHPNNGELILWKPVARLMLLLGNVAADSNTWRNRYGRIKTEEAAMLASEYDRGAHEGYPEVLARALEEAVQEIKAQQGAPKDTAAPKEQVIPAQRSDNFRDRVDYRKQELYWDHDRKVAKDLVEHQAITELLVEAVERGAREAPPVIWRPAPEVLIKPDAVEEVPVACLGDIHVGSLILPEEMGGLGEYNFEILKRRLDNYQTRIAQAIDLHRHDAKIRRMVVYFLGDMVEGEVIFDGQALRIELVSPDQLFEGASYIEGWLQGLLATGLVEEIHCVCVYGNHGRTTKKKGASKDHANWDYVMYKHMAAVLRNEPRIKWFIPKAWFTVLGIYDWRIYGSHGDSVKQWMGVPFYGIQRHDMRTTTLLQSVGVDYHYMLYGHFHVSATIPRVVGAQIMNGSTVGGSDFSMHQLSTASEPMQTVFGINERLGKTWQYDCVLDKRDPEEIRKHLAFTQI